MRECWNWQTGTFEVRVSTTYGFKSRLAHQRQAAAPKSRTSPCGVRDFCCPRFSLTSILPPQPKNSPRNHAVPGIFLFLGNGSRSPDLRTIYAQRFQNAQQKARNRPAWVPLPAFLFCLFFPGAYAFFRSTASSMHWLAASLAWATVFTDKPEAAARSCTCAPACPLPARRIP